LPEEKIKNYRLSVLNGKYQQKNEKDDYGDHFSTHLFHPFF
jgi:hypothetical protein